MASASPEVPHEREVLESIARGLPLRDVLAQIARNVERRARDMYCSLLLMDRDGKRVHHAAAPSLPAEFCRAIDGLPIGPRAGSCGTAAFRRERVVVEDIATSDLWADYRHIVEPFGLRACWSTPILSPDQEVLGTFAMYYREPRRPTERELAWIDGAIDLAAIAIQLDRSAEALRQSEAELRAVFENSALGMALVGADGRPVRSNPALERMLGYTNAELRGMSFVEFTHPEDAARDLPVSKELLAGKRTSYQIEKRYISKSGDVMWGRLSASVIRRQDGTAVYGIAMVEDINDRKRMEQAMRASEERIGAQAALLDRARDAILVHDLTGVIQYWNRGAERLYGWNAAEAVGRHVTELIYRDTTALERAHQQLTQAAEWSGDLVQWTKAGKRVIVDASWTLLSESGTPGSVLSINTDITARKNLELQVHRAQRMESLGTLAGRVAHDFNNILAAILANVACASFGLDPDHPTREFLNEIEKASERATDLVRQILTFSRHQEPRRQPVRRAPRVAEALTLLRSTLPAKLELRTSFAPDLPEALAEPTQVHQLVMNLGTNAMHAMAPGPGVLSVRADRVYLESALMVAGAVQLPAGPYARVIVEDTGSGMDEATMERIFDPFFTTKSAGEGTGLGLSVVHGIMKSYGGGVAVRSTPGKGTTFTLYFPSLEGSGKAAGAVSPAASRAATEQAIDGERIMCIDDEPAIVQVTTRLLEVRGYRVSGFTDPLRALHEFEADPKRYDAIVTDVLMPGLSGLELARRLLRVRPELPIVVTSGHIGPDEYATLTEIGVQEFVLKPTVIDELHTTLKRVLATAKRSG